MMSRIYISAAHKSSGKTTVSIGLCAALQQRGLKVQPFKKGPDYIDPMWLGQAATRPCYNLDFYTMQRDEILSTYKSRSLGSDITLIEGNKGLYDGLDLDGSNSNAALATLLEVPVILVLDARGMTRGIAPLILGYQDFDKEVYIAGVILNQLGGSRHEQKLRAVIEHYTDVPVIGAIHHDHDLEIRERHLGLIPSNESAQAQEQINQLAKTITQQVDLDALLEIAGSAPVLQTNETIPAPPQPASTIRLGIMRDAAFGFYYPGDLEALQVAGAKLIPIDAINDATLPAIDGLFIGGGFPETHMDKLAANHSLRQSIKQALENGLPCYAECGGLMYLARSISWQGNTAEMVGLLPGDIHMHKKPQGRGYIRIQQTSNAPWPMHTNEVIAGHEFHYSAIENLPADTTFAFEVKRGKGIDGQHDGIVYKNTLACYAHLRDTRQSPWARAFVDFIQQHKQK
jgi:cobyrinic acid a,c-diamide synthase